MKLKSSVAKLGAGTIIAQLFSILTILIITNLYLPEAYGKLNFCTSVVSILIPIATLRLETILVKSSTQEQIIRVAHQASKQIFMSCAIFFFCSLIFQLYYFNMNQDVILISFFLSILLLVQSQIILFSNIALKLKNYNQVSSSGVIQNLFTGLFQFWFGIFLPSSNSLIAGYLIGRTSGLLVYVKLMRNTLQNYKTKSINLNMLNDKNRFSNNYLVSTSFIESILLFSLAIILGHVFGLRYSGYIGVIVAIMIFPTTLFGTTFGSVLYAELADDSIIDNPNVIKKIKSSFILPVAFFSLFYIIFSMAAGPEIFGFISSDQWSASKNLIGILAIPFGINIIWKLFTFIMYLFNAWKCLFYFSFFSLSLALVLTALCIKFNGSWQFVALCFYAGQALGQILGIAYVFKKYLQS